MKRPSVSVGILGCVFLGASVVVWAAQTQPVLRWAGDPEGGAPFVEADPASPDRLVGFDVEVAGVIARGLGRSPQFVLIAFSSLDQSIARGDADIALIKRTTIRESLSVDFRTEIFNLTNTPPLGAPNVTAGNAAFGTIIGAGDPRVIQFAVKVNF